MCSRKNQTKENGNQAFMRGTKNTCLIYSDGVTLIMLPSLIFKHENIDTGSFIEKDDVIYRL